jgi:hypothetical protein
MKKLLLLLTIICGLLVFVSNTNADDGKANDDELLKKSQLSDFPPGNYPATSYPRAFTTTGDPRVLNPKTQPGISTGYYLVHSDDPAVAPWRPKPEIMDTTEDAVNWKRILSGPFQRDESYWIENPNEGRRYFRNPLSLPASMFDSVNNAIAGPIPIGFKFVFNGIQYDSFYVSTNGAIFLSNQRYNYDSEGNRELRTHNFTTYPSPSAYNNMSTDWYDRGGRSGNGMSDGTADDWGWSRAVTFGCTPSYSISSRPDNNGGGMNIPIIAPFFGDGTLVQWNDVTKEVEDRGRVYYYKDPNGYKLIVYFVDFQLEGSLKTPMVTFNGVVANRLQPWDNLYNSSNAQVVLDRRDSSITITYERFRGHIVYSLYEWVAKEVFRFNTSCAVSGPARHQNYNSKTKTGTYPWSQEYDQSTYAWAHYITQQHIGYPENTQAIKFKQWKNSLRVCDVAFRVRKQKENSPDFTDEILTTAALEYEILAGHEQIGQVQPVAIVQNLTNDIQGLSGVNYQPQDLNFRVRCAVVNQATRRPLYNKYIKVDSLAIALKAGEAAYEKVYLSHVKYTGGGSDYIPDTAHSDYYDASGKLKNWNGIPPYAFAAVFFPPFEPNELFKTHIGLMKAYVMVDPTDPRTGEGFRDMWPFDDTLNIRFWVMRHIPSTESFIDDVTEYHVIPDANESPVAIPSVYKWVSIGATVVNGENVSRNPLPPRGEYVCENQELYPSYKVSSPTIFMNRPLSVAIGAWGGHEIRTHPMDMTKKFGSVLTLAIQRTTQRADWERGWSDQTIVGCEHRVINSTWYTEVQIPDEIRVQFARPSQNWKDGTWITNIAKDNWTHHPRRFGASPETKMNAYTLFGGGGYMVGFLETDRDSALAPPVYSGARAMNGLRMDLFDDGIDFEYKKLYVPIPDTFIRASNEGAKYFRFRVQVYAKNNQLSAFTIQDDQDDFYVDNVRILHSDKEDVDIEMTKVIAEWPYTIAPASQAIAIPIRMQLSNNTQWQAPSFWVKTMIVQKSDFDRLYFLSDAWVYRGDPNAPDYEAKMNEFKVLNQQARDSARWQLLHLRPIYCRVKQLPMLRPGADETVTLPSWDARRSPPGQYVIVGVVYVPGGDLEPRNDTTFSTVNIRFGPVFAYHPVSNESNLRQAENGAEQMSGIFGLGLNIYGYKMGGVGTSWSPVPFEYGDLGGDGGSGQIAMKFELFQEDTVFGYGAYFAGKNQAPDHITYRMFTGENIPQQEILGSLLHSTRGNDGVSGQSRIFNSFVYELLPKGLVLPKGTYWISVAQLGEDGIELGASKSRVGMRSTNVYYHNPQTVDKNGSAGYFLNIEKTFRERERFGNLINKNFFAYENGLGSGAWEGFTNTVGNPGYAHLTHEGYSPVDNQTRTWSRASWLPLLVPYLGNRTYASKPEYIPCDIPVELVKFEGNVRKGAIDLVWETASEVDNYGFHVERRVVGDNETNWNTLPEFVLGQGTTNIPHEYNYVDSDVTPNTTYQYKLRQVDNDGTQSCDDFSNIVTLTYNEKGVVALYPNKPNPVLDGTTLSFSIPQSAFVTLEIVDVFGNVISTLANETFPAGTHTRDWRAFDENNAKIASGTYIYRLKVNDEVLTGKMSLIK